MRNLLVVLALFAFALAALAGCAGAGTAKDGSQRVAIQVTPKGFVPASVTVRANRPVTMVVTRRTDQTCAKELVMKEQNIHRALPLDQPVEIRFTPTHAGELRYACAMDMIAGRIVVR